MLFRKPRNTVLAVGLALAGGLVLWGCDDDDPVTPPTGADLAVQKSAGVPFADEGADVTFAVTLTNRGPEAAGATQVVDLVPPGLTFVSATATAGTFASATGTWSLSGLAVNAAAVLHVTVTVDSGTAGTVITNTATITSQATGDPVASNNAASATLSVGALSATVEGHVVRLRWPASTATAVRVLRKLNAAPVDANDPGAQVVYEGGGTTVVDSLVALVPAIENIASKYYYGLFDCADPLCAEITVVEFAPTLVQCLRAGGYTIFWRHADADVCADRLDLGTADTTSVPDWWRSCEADCDSATARQLNATGVANATKIGVQFDRLGIPVGRVLSSEYCRCFRTAELMDFGPAIELDTGITYWVYDEANRCTHCYDHLATSPAVSSNTAIIGHGGFPCNVLGGLAWSECAIFKPQPGAAPQYIARVAVSVWETLP
jgi:uncharacterized repeat protein (TIGR01451 family)